MFNCDHDTFTITMHRGDTGAVKVKAERASGTDWTEDDRLIFTVKAGSEIKMKRFYRLDDDDGLGNGVVEIQFHNNDTDTWENGTYDTELRYVVNPYWNGTAPTASCVDALTAGVDITDGDVVRVTTQSTMTLNDVYGEV